jgi:hypothetical protein
MTPIREDRYSARLISQASPYPASPAIRSSAAGWRSRALPGSMTRLAGFLASAGAGRSLTLSPGVTIDLPWEMRVQLLSMTGVSNRSESSKASRVKDLHSSESAGSSIGTLANRA